MEFKELHPWDVSYSKAVKIQEELRKQLIIQRCEDEIQLVAGADVSYSKQDERAFAAVVLFRLPKMIDEEQVAAVGKLNFPYIPGLLTFREAPILLKAFEQLRMRPHAVIFDGQGIAHPRGLGLASHMGLILDLPTIGCAKSKLVGEFEKVGENPGDFSPLTYRDKIVGAALRTRKGVKPVFVSPGHKIDLEQAVEVVVRTMGKWRIPEPTRQAHILVNQLREEYRLKVG